ncbi:MAG: glycosyltransferase, partial [Acidimicrobiales bacterium]
MRVSRAGKVGGVGAAKRAACALASGEVLVELDHDDLLARNCLARLAEVFAEDPSVVFACSDWAQIGEDGGRNDDRFNPAMGWVYDDVTVDGVSLLR